MEKLSKALKCVNCNELLQSPVLLPCNHSICKQHVQNIDSSQEDVKLTCGKCQCNHAIPANGVGFPENEALAEVIATQIGELDFGPVHQEARQTCDQLAAMLDEMRQVIADPTKFTHLRINEIRNEVLLKADEIKMKIDEEAQRWLRKLDECEQKSKAYLSSDYYHEELAERESWIKKASEKLNKWQTELNKFKFDEEIWEMIKKEGHEISDDILDALVNFKKDVLTKEFDVASRQIKAFQEINIDAILASSLFDFESVIIDSSKKQRLFDLCGFDKDHKWKLLYRGSQDGFGAQDFHRKCDHSPRTLTIIKSEAGHVFGGYTELEWNCQPDKPDIEYKADPSAFIFSLINMDNCPIKIYVTKASVKYAIGCSRQNGPIFGYAPEISIADYCDETVENESTVGHTYEHPFYDYTSKKAKTFLAGSNNFRVVEIEVFQKF